jgi:hypothetical protein
MPRHNLESLFTTNRVRGVNQNSYNLPVPRYTYPSVDVLPPATRHYSSRGARLHPRPALLRETYLRIHEQASKVACTSGKHYRVR